MKRFFSYTGSWASFDRHDTAEAAKAAVEEAIGENDDGLPDEAESWCWGEVRDAVKVTTLHTHGPECMGEDGCPEGFPFEDSDECVDVELVAVATYAAGADLRTRAEEVDHLQTELTAYRTFALSVARLVAPPDAEDVVALHLEAQDLGALEAHLAQERVDARAEIEHLRAQIVQLQADRALLVADAIRAYGTGIAPPGRATQERLGAALQAQYGEYPEGLSKTDAIRAILCRMAAEVTP